MGLNNVSRIKVNSIFTVKKPSNSVLMDIYWFNLVVLSQYCIYLLNLYSHPFHQKWFWVVYNKAKTLNKYIKPYVRRFRVYILKEDTNKVPSLILSCFYDATFIIDSDKRIVIDRSSAEISQLITYIFYLSTDLPSNLAKLFLFHALVFKFKRMFCFSFKKNKTKPKALYQNNKDKRKIKAG